MNHDPHNRLRNCLPELRSRVLQTLADMERRGHPMVVTDGFRTVKQQRDLYALGRTKPGKIVTNCDGVTRRSAHQEGRAADCAFVGPDGRITWDGPWSLYGRVAGWYGLDWGGNWQRFIDRPHVEWRGQ